MKFLGLMGVLLWLGTLFGIADGAERTRLDLTPLEKDRVGIEVPALCGATKCDADNKPLAGKIPAKDAEIIARNSLCFCRSACLVALPVRRAVSASVETWHLGRGPPRVLVKTYAASAYAAGVSQSLPPAALPREATFIATSSTPASCPFSLFCPPIVFTPPIVLGSSRSACVSTSSPTSIPPRKMRPISLR